jgi:hypothetical protein
MAAPSLPPETQQSIGTSRSFRPLLRPANSLGTCTNGQEVRMAHRDRNGDDHAEPERQERRVWRPGDLFGSRAPTMRPKLTPNQSIRSALLATATLLLLLLLFAATSGSAAAGGAAQAPDQRHERPTARRQATLGRGASSLPTRSLAQGWSAHALRPAPDQHDMEREPTPVARHVPLPHPNHAAVLVGALTLGSAGLVVRLVPVPWPPRTAPAADLRPRSPPRS